MDYRKGASFFKVITALSFLVLLFSLAIGANAALFANFSKNPGVNEPISSISSKASYDDWLPGYSYRMAVTNSSALPDYSFVNLDYGYYNASLSGIGSDNTETILNMQKVAVLNGQRYLFAGKGWGGIETASNIRVYKANQYWESTKLLDTSDTTYADFYVTTVPELWSDIAIIHGNTGTRANGLAFIGFFNATTNQFFDFQDLPSAKGDYLTQIYYIYSRDIFVMTLVAPSNATATDTIFTTTLENLKNPSAWVEHTFSNAAFTGCEHMFVYSEADGYGYFNRFSAFYGNEIVRVDMDSWTASQIWQHPRIATSGYLRSYIAATDSGIVFSTSNVTGTPSISNPGTWRYWSYNGTFNNFATVKIQGYSSNTYEGHANIFPTSNGFLLLSNVRDNDRAGYWYLYNATTFSLVETYQPSSSWHNSDNFAVEDGVNLILGGEGRTNVGLVILYAGLSRKVQKDFDDIRFTSNNGTTQLAYKLIEKSDADYAIFAVDTSSISSDTFYIYYGKSNATSGSNPSINPYLIYDTFNDSSFNTTTWTNISTGNSTLSEGSALTMTTSGSKGNPRAAFRSNKVFNTTTLPITIRTNFTVGNANVGNAACDWDGTLNAAYGYPQNAYYFLSADQLVSGYDYQKFGVSIGGSSAGFTYPGTTGVDPTNSHIYSATFGDSGFSGSADSFHLPFKLHTALTSGYVGLFSREYVTGIGTVVVYSYSVQPRSNAWLTFGQSIPQAEWTNNHAAHLLLSVEPSESVYSKGYSLTLKATVLNELNPALESTLSLTVTGPDGYYHYDFQPIVVGGDEAKDYSFGWVVPDIAGTYIVEVELVPPQLTAYDAVWLEAA